MSATTTAATIPACPRCSGTTQMNATVTGGTTTMRLYELPEAYRRWESLVEENGGEITPEALDELASLDATLAQKADAIAALIAERKGRAAYFAAERDRLAQRAQSETRAADSLRDYLKRTLEELGQSKVEGERFKVRIQRNGTPTIDVMSVGELPDHFKRVVVEADRDAIRQAHAAGHELPECVRVTVGTHLRIA